MHNTIHTQAGEAAPDAGCPADAAAELDARQADEDRIRLSAFADGWEAGLRCGAERGTAS